MIALCSYALLSALLVGLYRWLALRYRWLDTPNQRSSHTTTTPRGAGIIFALLSIGACAVFLRAELPPFLIGLIIACVGWWDDIRASSARLRLALYTMCAAATVILFCSTHIASPYHDIAVVVLLTYVCFATLGLVWLINLYNFMDGINGIAATQAVFVLFVIGVFSQNTPYAATFTSVHLWSSAAIGGFLLWNFPHGKVFMGDAGSAFLGFFLGVLMLYSTALHGPTLAVWLILLALFIADSGYTLCIRIATRQAWYSAHRSHAYQRLMDRLKSSHTRTVGVLMSINISWLLPIAWLVHNKNIPALLGVGLAYLPLLGGCYWLKAGLPK